MSMLSNSGMRRGRLYTFMWREGRKGGKKEREKKQNYIPLRIAMHLRVARNLGCKIYHKEAAC